MAKAAQKHPPGPCRDTECRRPFCEGYRLGYDEGWLDGYSSGYSAGYAAGVAAGQG